MKPTPQRMILTTLATFAVIAGSIPGAAAAVGDNNLNCATPDSLNSLATGAVCTEVGTVVASTGAGGEFTVMKDTSPTTHPNVALSGRGATFAGPIMTEMNAAYEADETQGVTSVYGICGSSCGKRAFFGEPSTSDANTLELAGRAVGTNPATTKVDACNATSHPNVDNTAVCIKWPAYGASEAPLSNTDETKAASFNGLPLHLPFIIGTVTLSYRIDGLTLPAGESLKLNAVVLEDMYFGDITMWNDAAIAALNPGATLPATEIIPVHRCDGSGTTFAWTDYLSRSLLDVQGTSKFVAHETFAVANPTLETTTRTGGSVGANTLDASTICGNGNPRVAQRTLDNNGAFGYVELGTAVSVGLDYAALENRDGNFIVPSPTTGSAAAAGVSTPEAWEDWSAFSFAWADGADSYPASSFSYFLVWGNPQQVTNPVTAVDYADSWSCTEYGALKDFFEYALGDEGQSLHASVSAAPIDEATQAKMLDAVDRFMNCGAEVVVTIPDVSIQGYPLRGMDANVRGTATTTATITATAFGPRNFEYGSVWAEGAYVRVTATVLASLPATGGLQVVLVDVPTLTVRNAFLNANHDWVPSPALVAGVGAHAVVEVVGQVVNDRLVVRDAGWVV